jgi:hypothetical protein
MNECFHVLVSSPANTVMTPFDAWGAAPAREIGHPCRLFITHV